MTLIQTLLLLIYGILLFVLYFCAGHEAKLYKNYAVYEVFPKSEKHMNILQQLERSSDSLIFPFGVFPKDGAVHVVVAPHKDPDFKLIMTANQIKYRANVLNLQEHLDAIDDQLKDGESVWRGLFSYNWKSYKTLQRTYSWMKNLVSKFPSTVDLLDVGTSYEGNKIYIVKISHKDNQTKPGILLEAGSHGREWISAASATYVINSLLTSDDVRIKNIARSYDWYIMPHANPDGYEYSQTTDRLWRKTRTRYGICFGADPNRNWGFYNKEVGSSSDPCSQTYAGPHPFSEAETLALSNFVHSMKGKIQLYLSFHSFAQLLLYPFGCTQRLPENAKDLDIVSKKTIEALQKPYGTRYSSGTIYRTLYPAAGSSIDWAHAVQGIKMAFTYELRPLAKGQPIKVGMQLPKEEIETTAKETLLSMIAMIEEIKNLGYFDTKDI